MILQFAQLSIDQMFSFLSFFNNFWETIFFYICFHYLNAGIKNSTKPRAFSSLYLCILPSYTLRIEHRKDRWKPFFQNSDHPRIRMFRIAKIEAFGCLYIYLHNLFTRTRQIKMFSFYLNQIEFSVQYLITCSSNTMCERFRYAKRWTLDTVSVDGNEQR